MGTIFFEQLGTMPNNFFQTIDNHFGEPLGTIFLGSRLGTVREEGRQENRRTIWLIVPMGLIGLIRPMRVMGHKTSTGTYPIG